MSNDRVFWATGGSHLNDQYADSYFVLREDNKDITLRAKVEMEEGYDGPDVVAWLELDDAKTRALFSELKKLYANETGFPG